MTSMLLTFPAGATQGHRECMNIFFSNDGVIEELECLAAYAIGSGVVASHFIAVCASDSGGNELHAWTDSYHN